MRLVKYNLKTRVSIIETYFKIKNCCIKVNGKEKIITKKIYCKLFGINVNTFSEWLTRYNNQKYNENLHKRKQLKISPKQVTFLKEAISNDSKIKLIELTKNLNLNFPNNKLSRQTVSRMLKNNFKIVDFRHSNETEAEEILNFLKFLTNNSENK